MFSSAAAQKAPQSGKRRHTAVRPSKCGAFSGRKVAHMPPCFQVPLRKRRRNPVRGGTLRCGHQSVALLVGEKQRTCRHVFKCHCGTFVFFLRVLYISLVCSFSSINTCVCTAWQEYLVLFKFNVSAPNTGLILVNFS